MTVAERVQDVVGRYGPDSQTSHAMLRSEPEFHQIVQRIEGSGNSLHRKSSGLYYSATKPA